MSYGYRRCLELAFTEAKDFFTECLNDPLMVGTRDPQDTDNQRVNFLVDLRKRLLARADFVNEFLPPLVNPYADWNQLRNKMTGPERADDNVLYSQFLQDFDVVDAMARLRALSRRTRIELTKAEDELSGFGPLGPPIAQPTPAAGPALIAPDLLTALQNIKIQAEIPERDLELAPMTIPTFDGNIIEYPEFWEAFDSLIGVRNMPDSRSSSS